MASDDSTSERCFTIGNTEPAESAFDVLHHARSEDISEEELASGLLALVEGCSEISVSVSNVRIVVSDNKLDIEVPTKILAVLLCCDKPHEVTWQEVQRKTPTVSPAHEWLVVSTRPLTSKTKQRIKDTQDKSAMHYIELLGPIQEAEDSESAGRSVDDDYAAADHFSRVENYWIRKPLLTASEKRLRRN